MTEPKNPFDLKTAENEAELKLQGGKKRTAPLDLLTDMTFYGINKLLLPVHRIDTKVDNKKV